MAKVKTTRKVDKLGLFCGGDLLRENMGGISKIYLINPSDIKQMSSNGNVVDKIVIKRKYGNRKRKIIKL